MLNYKQKNIYSQQKKITFNRQHTLGVERGKGNS